jgi:Tfp pilus assembly protein PilF
LNNVTLAQLPSRAQPRVLIGEQYRRLGERDKAIQRYRAALAKSPQNVMARQRLEELEKKPQ